jgi:hypothetical protein
VSLLSATAVNWDDWAVEEALAATMAKGGLEGEVLEVVISGPRCEGAWRPSLYSFD